MDGQRIIIFGGFGGAEAVPKVVSSQDSLYVLDLTNMQWSIPNVPGTKPNSRFLHQANVVGKYMVVSFGNYYERQDYFDKNFNLIDPNILYI